MNSNTTKKNTVICIFLALVIIFTLAFPAYGAYAYLEISHGDGDTMSDDFLQAVTVKLNGRIYSTSGHGAYFSVMKEDPETHKYSEDETKFRNYADTDSKTDEEGRYLPVIVNSNDWDGKSLARKSRINPYRVYNDVRAKAKLSKLT